MFALRYPRACAYAALLVRSINTTPSCCRSTGAQHYDALGVTPSASQAQIKSAYYERSKLFHPDTNAGSDDAAHKFRAVCEAYEVLGNVRLRRLYDKGFLHQGIRTGADDHPGGGVGRRGGLSSDDSHAAFHRSREQRHRPPTPSGRQPIYDFDEWSRMHYGATFARDMARKEHLRRHFEEQATDTGQQKADRVMFGLIGAIFFIFCLFAEESSSLDRVQNKD